jgi:hypothetical protein
MSRANSTGTRIIRPTSSGFFVFNFLYLNIRIQSQILKTYESQISSPATEAAHDKPLGKERAFIMISGSNKS